VASTTQSKTHKNGDAHLWAIPSFLGVLSPLAPAALLKDFVNVLKKMGPYWFTSFKWTPQSLFFRTFTGCNANLPLGGKLNDLTTIVKNALLNCYSVSEIKIKKIGKNKKTLWITYPKVMALDIQKKGVVVNVRKGGASFFADEAFRGLATSLGFWKCQPANNLCNGLYAIPDALDRIEQTTMVVNQTCNSQLSLMSMALLEQEWKKVCLPHHPDMKNPPRHVRNLLQLILKKNFLLTYPEVFEAMPRVAQLLSKYCFPADENYLSDYLDLNRWLLNLASSSR
jgi:hypothetical protein